MKTKLFIFAALLFLQAGILSAAQYDIRQMTPEIQSALSNRQGRYSQLQALKSSGALGENNRGYVEALQPSAQAVASAENSDRRVIYEAIVQQNGLGPSGIKQVEAAFADVQRGRAKPGESIQLPSGEWTKK